MADAAISEEIWKDIPGLEGYYQASSFGNIRSVTRFVYSKNKSLALKHGKVLALTPSRRFGYLMVRVSVANKSRTTTAHSLVCKAFHGEPSFSKRQVAHIDGTRTNNRADNLRWDDAKGNAADRVGHGTQYRGEEVSSSKLTADIVLSMRSNYHGKYGDLKRLSQIYGVTSAQVLNIVKRKQWQHI